GESETVKPPVKLDVAVAEQKPEETTEEKSGAASETEQPSAQEDEASDTMPASDTKPKANTNEMTKQDDDTTKPASSTTSATTSAAVKSVTIVSGDGSFTVAKKLAEAGVVNSAAAFDTFLCENGYDKRLRTGTFQIPADAGDEQIARIVTGQE
ncbi:MAG: endolytic transglycosylase MltG, partial [Lachnospiraceae bacterium]|nr:endolytic transglycosylase MltG [Lachnospiraceae bacterium]